MKQAITILFLFLFCNVYGQQWHLNEIDTTSEFKYQYWFQFDNIDDTSSYNFEKRLGSSKSTFQLRDKKGDTILFAKISIKNLENDTAIVLFSDYNGVAELYLKPGNYTVKLSAHSYADLSFEFTISSNEYFTFNVKLAFTPEQPIYQINSKEALFEPEILTIMNCIKKSLNEFFIKCSDQKRYYLTMHI